VDRQVAKIAGDIPIVTAIYRAKSIPERTEIRPMFAKPVELLSSIRTSEGLPGFQTVLVQPIWLIWGYTAVGLM